MGVKRKKRDIIEFLTVFLVSLIVYGTVGWYDSYIYRILYMDDYLNLHLGLEGLSILMSFCIFLVAFYTLVSKKNTRTFVFMCTFISIGILDYMHTLTYKGMPGFLAEASVDNATAFWIAARITGAFGLLVASLTKPESIIKLPRFGAVLAALLYSGTIIYLIAYKPEIIPPLFIEGHGLTPLKIYLEYSIIVLHIITIILFFMRYLKAECAKEYRYMILSLLLCIFSEISFAAYTSVYDTYNLLGHLYKIIAYYLLFKAKFVSNVQKPYLALHKAEAELQEYVDNLEQLVEQRTEEIRTANDKLLKDMDYARHIQTALLPLSFPITDKLQFAARYLPCEKIGGDFYNVYRLDEDNIGILIGDVAGHGVSAAMITVFINQNIHIRREYDDGRIRILTPKQVLTNLFYIYNRMSFPDEIYTVLFYGIYNIQDKILTYSSAGMNTAPLVVRRNGNVDSIPVEGLPICKLGGLVNPSYDNQVLQLEEGDTVLFYTDGLIEIDRKHPNHFNEDNLKEYLRGIKNTDAPEMVNYMFDLYYTILDDKQMIDDVTVLAMKIEGKVETAEMKDVSAF
jgi:sigma-B regulation protein RsbU (phosphoserine phosphatase)